jgi:exonuclease VII small subunit
MSDKDLIITFLKKAEKRSRSNKRFNDIAITLAIAFVVPVLFKVLDFFFLFRGRTIVAFLAVWLIATATWVILRLQGKNPLSLVAGNVDRKANLKDQLKTAYWFIEHPRNSEWVDVQIRRTAEAANRLRLDALYPRRFPRAIYLVCGLVFVMVALNFLPLSLNYNWIRLQAAPPFRLTEEARASLENALKLLERAKATENAAIAEKLQNLINNLEQGDISLNDAIKQLEELEQELETGDIDAENVTNGLSQMAAILRQSRALHDAAQSLAAGKLEDSASQMQQVGSQLDSAPATDIREMAEKFLQASEKPRSGLQDLASAFENASGALQRGDRTAARSAFDRISRELQNLSQQLKDQQLRSEAGDEIADLVDALEEGDAQAGSKEAGQPNSGQGKSDQKTGGKGDPNEKGEAGDKAGEAGQDSGQNGEPGEAGDQGDAQQLAPGEAPAEGPNGKGGNSFGGSTKSAPLEGEATALEVQLQKEALKLEGAAAEGTEPDSEKEAAGERERSKLDYRNAPSDLTPAQKDLLSQERIPWENRQLIKNYFQAVKSTQAK